MGNGFLDLVKRANPHSFEGRMMNAQLAQSIEQTISDLPNMSAYEIGYGVGYGAEKLVDTVALTKGVGLATNAVKSAATASKVSKLGTVVNGEKAIVIGEGMEAVKQSAKALQSQGINAKWYQAWSKNFPSGRRMTPYELEPALRRNKRWIKSKIKNGYDIYDIGPSGRTIKSPFYRLEKEILEDFKYPTIPLKRR